jgi:hypothetical protein
MPSSPPAEIGAPLSEIDTPALIVDLDVETLWPIAARGAVT